MIEKLETLEKFGKLPKISEKPEISGSLKLGTAEILETVRLTLISDPANINRLILQFISSLSFSHKLFQFNLE